jgi:hypothetical protein
MGMMTIMLQAALQNVWHQVVATLSKMVMIVFFVAIMLQ